MKFKVRLLQKIKTMRKLKNAELDRKTIDEFKQAKKTPLIIILDNVRSLNNVGSVFRTADAFLVEKIYLCGITATPPHKDIRKTALGATENVAWEYVENGLALIERLKEGGVHVVSIEQAEESTSLEEIKINKDQKYALIFGNEVKGVDQKIVSASNEVVEIPQEGVKHSLNISVSVGVCLWEYYKKLKF